jgi:hypothetical protein
MGGRSLHQCKTHLLVPGKAPFGVGLSKQILAIFVEPNRPLRRPTASWFRSRRLWAEPHRRSGVSSRRRGWDGTGTMFNCGRSAGLVHASSLTIFDRRPWPCGHDRVVARWPGDATRNGAYGHRAHRRQWQQHQSRAQRRPVACKARRTRREPVRRPQVAEGMRGELQFGAQYLRQRDRGTLRGCGTWFIRVRCLAHGNH